MKSIILATGISSNLQPFTGEYPTSLLEVGGKSILDRLLADVDEIDAIDGHLIVTNEVCYPYLKAWSLRTHYKKPVTLINEAPECVQNKKNPMCGIVYVIERLSLDEEVLIVDGSIVVDGSLTEFVRQARVRGCSCIACYREASLPALKDGGVVVFDTYMKVVAVHDRPQVPPTRWGVASFMYLTGADVVKMYKAVAEGVSFDSPITLFAWLCAYSTLYAWLLPGEWFDIRDASLYATANELFRKKRTL